jgi:hypothetical protein
MPLSAISQLYHDDIAEILLKVALNTKNKKNQSLKLRLSCLGLFALLAPEELNYLTFQSFNYEHT